MFRIDAIDFEISKLLDEVMRLGEEGKVEESEALNNEVEKLKKKKEELMLIGDNPLNPNVK